MKKIILSLICSLGLSVLVSAQNTAVEKVVPFDKANTRPGYSVTYKASAKDVNTAVKNRMTKEGLKGKGFAKNVTKYEQVNKPYICAQTCDLYLKVEGSGSSANLTCLFQKVMTILCRQPTIPKLQTLQNYLLKVFQKTLRQWLCLLK